MRDSETELVRTARVLAQRAHAGQRRKAGNVPYFTHLEAVAELVVEHGYDDEVTVAAAYLHDLLEDQPAYADELRALMPPAVVETVEVLSEAKLDARGNERPKTERFDDYCAALSEPSEAARRALPISAADKIHNAYSLIEADAKERLLQRLSTRPGEHRAHFARLRVIYAGAIHLSLLRAFDDATAALLAKIEEWLPTRAAQIAAEATLGLVDEAGQARAFARCVSPSRSAERPSSRRRCFTMRLRLVHGRPQNWSAKGLRSTWCARPLRSEEPPMKATRAT